MKVWVVIQLEMDWEAQIEVETFLGVASSRASAVALIHEAMKLKEADFVVENVKHKTDRWEDRRCQRFSYRDPSEPLYHWSEDYSWIYMIEEVRE